ncbi:MAG: acyl-CoA dehydratase activase-related protein, partial [Spirochaetota bacterium]
CNRTLIRFNDGSEYITGNRCEKGEILGDQKDPEIRKRLTQVERKMSLVPDMIKLHSKSLTKDYAIRFLSTTPGTTGAIRIGIPRVLEYWQSFPYWKAVFTALGFDVVISGKSTYDLFESGLHGIPSDTICFPAKIAHGHVLDLVKKKVDRIFWPMILRSPKMNRTAQGAEMCPIVQGYPMVVEKSEEIKTRYGIPFDHPAFHWFNKRLKRRQTAEFLRHTFGLPGLKIRKALWAGEKAYKRFARELLSTGEKVLKSLKGRDDFAILLAGRPYHSDELVNHNLSSHFTRLGIPVLTLFSIPKLHRFDVRKTRIDSYNPSHTMMLEAAFFAARNPKVELVQIVNFGCGHDAILSDEMARILRELAGKELLILKMDEGENSGPLNLRIQSFIETIRVKRASSKQTGVNLKQRALRLQDSFPLKFLKRDKKRKTILIPNLSSSFTYLSARVIEKLGYKALPLPIADKYAIELGKRYVHNDICFPAQVNIGEIIALVKRSDYRPEELAAGLAKNCIACRAGQYAGLARKALDDAGYLAIPIITTGSDAKKIHPGFRLGVSFAFKMLWGLTLVDSLEYMRRRIRPYEIIKGETNFVFDSSLKEVIDGLMEGVKKGEAAFVKAVKRFNEIAVSGGERKPRVGILGEILVNYHPSANGFIEEYLEKNGLEVIIPGMVDFFRRKNIVEKEMGERRLHPTPRLLALIADAKDTAYEIVFKRIVSLMKEFRFTEPRYSVRTTAKNIEGLIDKSYLIGEGWLIPAEIIEMAKHGVNSFIIVQPFGCMPNHITGRGMIKSLKTMFPHIQILSLDYDPDTSFGNIENRLQMLIITARELEKTYSPPNLSYNFGQNNKLELLHHYRG